jgi:riboflavin biosynthesis pyrimidine reductase
MHLPQNGVGNGLLLSCAASASRPKAGASRFGSVATHALDTVGDSIDPLTKFEFLRSQFGVQILLHEGGPTLFGQFLAAEAVDELFLTLSPQIAAAQRAQIGPESCKACNLHQTVHCGINCLA